MIIDVEIAALDSEGKSSFQLLQSYGIGKRTPLVYYAFDLLNLARFLHQMVVCAEAGYLRS